MVLAFCPTAELQKSSKKQSVRLPYGSGIQAPDHVVEFPVAAEAGHELATTRQQSATAN